MGYNDTGYNLALSSELRTIQYEIPLHDEGVSRFADGEYDCSSDFDSPFTSDFFMLACKVDVLDEVAGDSVKYLGVGGDGTDNLFLSSDIDITDSSDVNAYNDAEAMIVAGETFYLKAFAADTETPANPTSGTIRITLFGLMEEDFDIPTQTPYICVKDFTINNQSPEAYPIDVSVADVIDSAGTFTAFELSADGTTWAGAQSLTVEGDTSIYIRATAPGLTTKTEVAVAIPG